MNVRTAPLIAVYLGAIVAANLLSAHFRTIGSPAWTARMAEAMGVVCDGEGRPGVWLHMLRGLALCGGPYPFASADSTNIARNHGGTNSGRVRMDVVAMADRIDGVQCPARWLAPCRQLELEAA